MGMILKSKARKGWLLKIGDPAGTAYLEIQGLTHHLNKPYLFIQYIPGGANEKVFAGYRVEGWFVAGWLGKPVTTNKFLAILRSLGFTLDGGIMSANAFRTAITKDLTLAPTEESEAIEEEPDEVECQQGA